MPNASWITMTAGHGPVVVGLARYTGNGPVSVVMLVSVISREPHVWWAADPPSNPAGAAAVRHTIESSRESSRFDVDSLSIPRPVLIVTART